MSIIEHFKGNQNISKILHSIGIENISISAITEMEILFGSKNKRESVQIKKALSDLTLHHLNENISETQHYVSQNSLEIQQSSG